MECNFEIWIPFRFKAMVVKKALHSVRQDVRNRGFSKIIPQPNVSSKKQKFCDCFLIPKLCCIMKRCVSKYVLLVYDTSQVGLLGVKDDVQTRLIIFLVS